MVVYNCPKCSKKITKSGSICCFKSTCGSYTHLDCIYLITKEAKVIQDSFWCLKCQTSKPANITSKVLEVGQAREMSTKEFQDQPGPTLTLSQESWTTLSNK